MLFKYYPYLYWPLFLKRGGLWLFCSIKIRSTGFGVFETAFGIAWFLGSWLFGVLYGKSLVVMVVVSLSSQVLGIIFHFLTLGVEKKAH